MTHAFCFLTDSKVVMYDPARLEGYKEAHPHCMIDCSRVIDCIISRVWHECPPAQ